jgi:hypothetical protein
MAIIIWLGCMIGCGLLADSKGRSVVTGVLLGLLFGIFALIGYLIIGPAGKCNKCMKSIHPDATICSHCRTPIE